MAPGPNPGSQRVEATTATPRSLARTGSSRLSLGQASYARRQVQQVAADISAVRRNQEAAVGRASLPADAGRPSDRAAAPREFVTKRPAVMHVAPSASSARIGVLESGRRCTEVVIDRPVEGWLAIEPQGYVRLDDVVALQDRPLVIESSSRLTPRSRRLSTGDLHLNLNATRKPRRLSTSSSISSVSEQLVSDVDAWALKAEQVRLREANVELREEKLEVASGLERARQERERLAKEIEELRREKLNEQATLERYREVKGRMQEKLVRCREVVQTTVMHVDLIYDGSEEEARGAMAEACAGAAEAGELLAVLEEEACEEDGVPGKEAFKGQENDLPPDAEPARKIFDHRPSSAGEKGRALLQQQQQRVFGGSTHNMLAAAASGESGPRSLIR